MYLAAAILVSSIFFLIFSSKYMLLLPVILIFVRIFIFNEKAAFFGIASLFIIYYVSIFNGFDFLYISSIRRALFLNVLITESYLGIYENLGPQLFLNDALSFLGSSNISLPYLAGESIYSSASGAIHTNTGSVGFSLAQLGFFGPIIYGILYGIYFSLMGVKNNINGPNVIILIYISIQSAGISDIFTTMLLHGGALLLLLFRFGELNAKKDTSQATLFNKSKKQSTL
jgi:hypothetical protein